MRADLRRAPASASACGTVQLFVRAGLRRASDCAADVLRDSFGRRQVVDQPPLRTLRGQWSGIARRRLRFRTPISPLSSPDSSYLIHAKENFTLGSKFRSKVKVTNGRATMWLSGRNKRLIRETQGNTGKNSTGNEHVSSHVSVALVSGF